MSTQRVRMMLTCSFFICCSAITHAGTKKPPVVQGDIMLVIPDNAAHEEHRPLLQTTNHSLYQWRQDKKAVAYCACASLLCLILGAQWYFMRSHEEQQRP